MGEGERTFTDEELDRAVEALSDPERFRAAEARVTHAAPRLQRVLDQALGAGWLGEAQAQQARQVTGLEDPAERSAAVQALMIEEARIGMLVGVAVGWELARELELQRDNDTRGDED